MKPTPAPPPAPVPDPTTAHVDEHRQAPPPEVVGDQPDYSRLLRVNEAARRELPWDQVQVSRQGALDDINYSIRAWHIHTKAADKLKGGPKHDAMRKAAMGARNRAMAMCQELHNIATKADYQSVMLELWTPANAPLAFTNTDAHTKQWLATWMPKAKAPGRTAKGGGKDPSKRGLGLIALGDHAVASDDMAALAEQVMEGMAPTRSRTAKRGVTAGVQTAIEARQPLPGEQADLFPMDEELGPYSQDAMAYTATGDEKPFYIEALKNYPGSKGAAGTVPTRINLIPPHTTFMSPFLGHCAVMRHKLPARFNYGVDADPKVVRAWRTGGPAWLHVTQGDALKRIDSAILYDATAFLFLDPPYLLHTLKGGRRLYAQDGGAGMHERLLELLKRAKCMVMLCGLPNDMYTKTLKGWRHVTYENTTRQGLQTEGLWMNYPEPMALHDYRWIGTDYRERERIKRLINRRAEELAARPALERAAILHRLGQLTAK